MALRRPRPWLAGVKLNKGDKNKAVALSKEVGIKHAAIIRSAVRLGLNLMEERKEDSEFINELVRLSHVH